MTAFILLVLLNLLGPCSLLGLKTFLIYNESSKRCLRAENPAPIMTKCDENSIMQKFQWISTEHLLNVGTSQCLSVSSLAEGSAVTLSTCDGNSDLQKWECKNGTWLGIQKADLYMSYRDKIKLALFSGTDDWNQWKIYSTDDALCANSYEEIYSLGGNGNGQPCKFPFKYKNKIYLDCTADGDEERRFWCSTTINYDKDKLYGYCPSKSKLGSFWTTDSVSGVNYQINSNAALSWHQARISCQQQDSKLLSITELHEQTYISGALRGLTTALWIGLNNQDSNGGWRWDDGAAFRYLNWLPGNPSVDPDVNCVTVNPGKNTKWESKECKQKLGYICKKDNSQTADAPSPGTSDPTFCPSSWFPYNGYCYYLVRENKTWQDAVLSCRKEESDLASLHNIEEVSAVALQLQFGDAEYVWLGLNDLKTQLFFEWSDGSPVTYTTWQRGEPSHLIGIQEDCVVLSTKDGQWADKICEKRFPYICKRKSLPNDQEQDTEAQPGCDQGWKRYGSYCYLIGESLSTFAEANSTCNHHGAFLMTIEDRFEQAYLTSLIGFRPEKYYWTGLSDMEDSNTFKWANRQKVLYTHWNADMPNRRQGCVAVRTGNKAGLWDVINCEEKTKYVCKKLAQGATPPPVPTTTAEPTCPTNWTSSGDACFKHYSSENYEKRTWLEARDFCRTVGGDLLSITSREDETTVFSLMGISRPKPTWIGLVLNNLDEGFTWSDGTPLNYKNWYFMEPNNLNGEEFCGMLYKNGHSNGWNDIACDHLFPWVCKLKKGAVLKEEPKPTEYEFTSDGWLIYNDSQYYISKDEMPMEKAREFCNRNFSHLVTINSEPEWKFLWKYIANKINEPSYYIGLHLGLDKEFKWMDGSPVDFVAWNSEEPNFVSYDEYCTEMLTSRGLWNDINCGMPRGFICERTNSSINATFAPTVPAPEGGCPSDWLSFGKKCYGIFGTGEDEGVHWDNARRECQSLGGDLVTINDDLVQAFLMSNLKNTKADVWIGLHDKHRAAKFVWSDQSGVYYTNWAKGHPHMYRFLIDGPIDCVVLQFGSILNAGTWAETDCSLEKGYICQKYKDPSFPVIPTTPPLRDYYNYGDASYKFDKTKRSWDEARQECRKDNAQLASILDEYTTSFLKLHLVKHKEPFWIGLHSSNETKNTYKWVDNWGVRYTKWAPEQPRKNLFCVYVDTDGQWKTAPCNETYSSICKQTSAVPPTDPPEMPGTCPDTSQAWIPFRSHCYSFISSFVEWSQASVQCVRHGASLTSIEDSTEVDFLLRHTELLTDQQKTFWIGLYKNVEDKWLWLDNTPMDFVNWNNEAPQEDMSSQCVMMDAVKGTWGITPCIFPKGYICKTLKTPLSTETIMEKQEKTSHGMTVGVVVLVMLFLAGAAVAVFLVYKRRWIQPRPENGFNNRIYLDGNSDGMNVLVESIEQNEH
ncbi:macrophage mannose receptor 1-like isoform X2 [Dendropsophus ebraccatus]|uniref:macrophage mannose receptor 1-like isoform X2 n=1 Tax=Dendropsophus ebraccatus TaxID=150705 RepID=UPI003831B37B